MANARATIHMEKDISGWSMSLEGPEVTITWGLDVFRESELEYIARLGMSYMRDLMGMPIEELQTMWLNQLKQEERR